MEEKCKYMSNCRSVYTYLFKRTDIRVIILTID